MCDIPSRLFFLTGSLVISLPFINTWPSLIGISPVIPYTSSDCPLPSIPAMQRISPAFAEKETSLTIFFFEFFALTVKFLTSRIGFPVSISSFSMLKLILRPTIISDICSLVVVSTSTVPIYLPFLKTVHRSAASLISFNLCEMKTIDFPSLTSSFIIFINSSISCGVKTAVGSSKINISLSEYSILSISTLCCMPTVISEIYASGSIFNL